MNIFRRPLPRLRLPLLLLSGLSPLQAAAETGRWDPLNISLGFTIIDPGLSSDNVQFFPDGGGEIELDDTIKDRGSSTRPGLTLTWRLAMADGNFSLETVLAPPFRFSFEFTGGALADAIDGKLGETDMLPPALMLTYNFPVNLPVRPYMGLGGTYLYSFNSEITASELDSAKLEIENVATWLIQAGANIDLDWLGGHEKLFLNFDVKYIDPVRAKAEISNITSIGAGGDSGDAQTRLKLEPWAFSMGLGWRF